MERITRLFWCYSFLLASIGLTLSCGSGSNSNVQQPQPPDIYVAGYEVNDSNTEIGQYWKNGSPVILGTSPEGSVANAIFVSGNDVYVAGVDGNSVVYWKNGVEVTLPTRTQNNAVADAFSIFVNGNDVYVAGFDGGGALYWKNGVPVPLTDGTTNPSVAWSILVSGNDVYVAGSETKTTPIDPTLSFTTSVAEYWKNSVATQLSDGQTLSVAYSLFLSGSDIYVAGDLCQSTNPGCDLATYWKNGTPVALTSQTPTTASSIFVSGTDVYVAGNDFTGNGTAIADLWKDGMLTQLSHGGLSAANAVVVAGTDVYVAGANVSGNQEAGYWKNGVFTSVTDGTHFATIFGIAVVTH